MPTPLFITLHHLDGSSARYSAAHIVSYGEGTKGLKKATFLETVTAVATDAVTIWITETPQQLDALLGVTEVTVLSRTEAEVNDLRNRCSALAEAGGDGSVEAGAIVQAFDWMIGDGTDPLAGFVAGPDGVASA